MKKVEQIFHAALQIEDPEKRAAFVRCSCAGDEPLRREVEALLRADAAADKFFTPEPE